MVIERNTVIGMKRIRAIETSVPRRAWGRDRAEPERVDAANWARPVRQGNELGQLDGQLTDGR